MNETFRIKLTPAVARRILLLARVMQKVEIDPLILEVAQLSEVDEDLTYDLSKQQAALVQELIDFDLRGIVAVAQESNTEWIMPTIRAAKVSGVEHIIVSSVHRELIYRAANQHGYTKDRLRARSKVTNNSMEELMEYRDNGLLLMSQVSGHIEYPKVAMEFPRTVVVTPYSSAQKMQQFSSLPAMAKITDDPRVTVSLGMTPHARTLSGFFNISTVMLSQSE
jgi:hypothetical protein